MLLEAGSGSGSEGGDKHSSDGLMSEEMGADQDTLGDGGEIVPSVSVHRDEEDSGSEKMKWLELMNAREDYEGGQNLLQAMEMVEGESETMKEVWEEKEELNEEIIAAIEEMREKNQKLEPCANKSKMKGEKWGPTLIERQRMKPNGGITVMQRAMDLKKKKNLEPLKGNAFLSLHSDTLSKLASDVSLKLGASSEEMEIIVRTLVEEDKENFKNFVGDNPDMTLPCDANVEEAMQPAHSEGKHVLKPDPDKLGEGQSDNAPDLTLDKPDMKSTTSPMWTEVVKRGRNRSRSGQISVHDRCILEF
jgi:hypothetical protein